MRSCQAKLEDLEISGDLPLHYTPMTKWREINQPQDLLVLHVACDKAGILRRLSHLVVLIWPVRKPHTCDLGSFYMQPKAFSCGISALHHYNHTLAVYYVTWYFPADIIEDVSQGSTNSRKEHKTSNNLRLWSLLHSIDDKPQTRLAT